MTSKEHLKYKELLKFEILKISKKNFDIDSRSYYAKSLVGKLYFHGIPFI